MRGAVTTVVVILLTSVACQSPKSTSTTEQSPEQLRFEESYVTTPDGVRLYVRVAGTGPDTVIVPAAAWLARDLGPLVPGRTLIFFDPRGRGASDAVLDTARLGLELEIGDIDFVREQFGIERLSLIGWSYLGAVVALYAAEHPEHVKRVVQVGPMAPTTELARIEGVRGSPPDSTDRALVADLRRSDLPTTNPVAYCREYAMRMMIRPMMGRPEAAAGARLDPCLYSNEWPDNLFRMIPYVVPREWDYTDRARRVVAPVLIVHGSNDPNAAIEGGRAWGDLIPSAQLLEIEGVGHAPWLEAPDEFFKAVDEFLRGG